MKRQIYEELLKWKNNSDGKTAMLIEGARRIGKSYIALEFAKKNYKSYVLIDFFKEKEEIKNLFNDYLDDMRREGLITINRTAGLNMIYVANSLSLDEIFKKYFSRR